MLEALQATADSAEEFGEEIANSAADIFTALKFSKNSTYGNKKPVPQPKVERIPSTEEVPDDDGLFGALDTSSHSDKGHRFLKYNSKAKTITVKVTGLTTQVQTIRSHIDDNILKCYFNYVRRRIVNFWSGSLSKFKESSLSFSMPTTPVSPYALVLIWMLNLLVRRSARHKPCVLISWAKMNWEKKHWKQSEKSTLMTTVMLVARSCIYLHSI